MSREGRLAFDALLRRAIDPFEALVTWPLSSLFSCDEADAVNRAGATSSPAGPGGYLCAIAKFTRLCNLRCTYCNDWRDGLDQTMSFPVMLRLFERLLAESGCKDVLVVWHGGEPTLLKRRGVLRVLAIQRRLRRPGQRLRNVFQTNATNIDASWARLLSRFGFEVGFSLDGPAWTHDAVRPRIGGGGSFEAVRAGLHALRSEGIVPSACIVLGPAQLELGADALVRFLQEQGILQIGLLPVRPAAGPKRDGAMYLDRSRFVHFLLDVERARRAAPEPWLSVRELDAAARAARGEPSGFCELQGNCIGSYFMIEPDGRVGHCDKYLGDPDYLVGDIHSDSFEAIRQSPRTRALQVEAQRADESMRSCRYYRYCRGWCPHEHYSAARYDSGSDPSCCGLSELFKTLCGEGAHARH
jgi:uncharacterized protein